MKPKLTTPGGFKPHVDLPKRYEIEEVLPYRVADKRSEGARREYDGWSVNMWSQRYHMFAQKGCTCVSCGREGSFFLLRRNTDPGARSNSAHFNLWCEDEDGTLVMITKDHIKPKSRGGRDTLDNYQPMCVICNQTKGNKE